MVFSVNGQLMIDSHGLSVFVTSNYLKLRHLQETVDGLWLCRDSVYGQQMIDCHRLNLAAIHHIHNLTSSTLARSFEWGWFCRSF
jgi:hypothetical protein